MSLGPFNVTDFPILEDELSVSFDLENIKIRNASVDSTPSPVIIND